MLSNFLTPKTDSSKINAASLLLRLGMGLLMIPHGYGKLTNFGEIAPKFMTFMGLNGEISLGLAVFAEFACSILLVLGLTTRAILIPLTITMLVAVFIAHGGDPLAKKELGLMYLTGYIGIFTLGAGKYSLDALIFKRRVY